MTGTIIQAEQWPEDAALHTWDGANGQGYWTVYDKDGEIWTVRASHIPMPAGHDWRVPVMRQQLSTIDLEQGLRDLYRAYVRLLESGRDRIKSLGGDCDPVDVMEQTDIDLRKVRDLLALIDGQVRHD